MSRNGIYTEDQITEFCNLAQDVGIAAATRELGYPKSRASATHWLQQRNIVITKDSLAQRAIELKHFYNDQEQLTILHDILDRIHETLSSQELEPNQISRLANAARSTIETMRLIGGETTAHTKIEIDSLDIEMQRLLAEFEANENSNANTS